MQNQVNSLFITQLKQKQVLKRNQFYFLQRSLYNDVYLLCGFKTILKVDLDLYL